MKRQVYKVSGFGAVIGAVLCAVGGWWWSSSQTVAAPALRPGAESRAAAATADMPDTRRDVLIAARQAVPAPAIGAGTWINSAPLTLESLRGRVVIVDFWTFGCYNCRNTLPTLKRWDARYRREGLTIIGIHSPEADHEKDIGNVRRQVRSLGIRYPVVTDNSYDTWRAYGIEAWPTTVILDRQGRIRFMHIGEGMYDEMERAIRNLLAEPTGDDAAKKKMGAADGTGGGGTPPANVSHNANAPKGVEVSGKIVKSEEEWRQQLTPEQYYVTRLKGTERAFTGEYYNSKEKGVYKCVACGLELFNSNAKYESGTGWPSFYQPIAAENVEAESDTTLGMQRIEVKCRRCGAHLGHVFDDGPQPTGLRYCINSVALKLEEKE